MSGRVHPWRQRALSALVIATCVVGSAVRAPAQDVYRWTDERGVVNFSQAPPASATDIVLWSVEIPVAAAPAPPSAANGEPAAPLPLDAKARIDLVRHKTFRAGAKAHDFSGAVKNTGNRAATDVAIVVDVRDDQTSGNCFETRIAVNPARLEPGQEGTFAREFSDPCFFGDIHVDMKPTWRDG